MNAASNRDPSARTPRPFVLGLAGGSASGKSTLAAVLAESFGTDRAAVLALDRYYRPLEDRSHHERASTNFDAPDALDLALFVDHLQSLRRGQAVDLPEYCFREHQRLPSAQRLVPGELLIVEGVLLLAQPRIRALLDRGLWIEVQVQERRERRLRRDVAERGRSVEQVERQWREHVRPMEELHEARSRDLAQQVLDGTAPLSTLVTEVRALVERSLAQRSV